MPAWTHNTLHRALTVPVAQDLARRALQAADPAAGGQDDAGYVYFFSDIRSVNEEWTRANLGNAIVDDAALRDARLCLIAATRRIIASGLDILGVSAPDSM